MIEQHTYQHDEIPPDLKCQILSFLRIVWPEDFTKTPEHRSWISRPEHHSVSFVLVDSGSLVSHAEVVWKYVDHAAETFKVYGLGGVFTYPDYRGEGHGKRIVDAATASIRASDADVAMLFCASSLKDFYAGFGWIAMERSATLVGAKDSLTASNELRMMLFLSEKGQMNRSAFEREDVYFGESGTW